jgi:hypothetical protein
MGGTVGANAGHQLVSIHRQHLPAHYGVRAFLQSSTYNTYASGCKNGSGLVLNRNLLPVNGHGIQTQAAS